MAQYINKDTYVGDTNKQLKDIATLFQLINALNYSLVEYVTTAYGDYLKFDNGIAIAFRAKSITVNINNAWGNIYYGKHTEEVSFPFGLFISPPIVLWDFIPSATIGCFKVHYEKPTITKDGISNISMARPSSGNNVGMYVYYIAIGKWK